MCNADEEKQNRDELRNSSHEDPHTLELLKDGTTRCRRFDAVHFHAVNARISANVRMGMARVKAATAMNDEDHARV